jgi:hypothetical protein
MDVLLLGWQLEIHKLHILSATQTKVVHERLKKRFAALVSRSQSATDLRIEDFRLLDTSGDVKKLDKGV